MLSQLWEGQVLWGKARRLHRRHAGGNVEGEAGGKTACQFVGANLELSSLKEWGGVTTPSSSLPPAVPRSYPPLVQNLPSIFI